MGASGGGCGISSAATSGAGLGVDFELSCAGLCCLKQTIEQLERVSGVVNHMGRIMYYGIEQLGHLYFLGAVLQIAQRTCAILKS